MAKVSPVSIKYMVHASFKAQGPLEKPDVIGAIFGQTEGLLGDELEMRELQKEGKIGRIEVDLELVDGKSVGVIHVPSALDKSETTIIAAALETIDRVGPTEAEIKVDKIEDVRGSKRDFIISRAKELLGGLDGSNDMGGLSKSVTEESRAARLQDYGEEKLPAGDLSGNEVIVVEGRADVVTLLKNRVNNVIGMNGTKLPAEIARLGESKELTLFVDGDRGGKLIAKNVISHAKIAYVAVAPDGKEVEELMGKELLLALRKKIPMQEYMRRERFEPVVENSFSGDPKEALRGVYEKIRGTKQAALVNAEMDIMRKVSNREVSRSIRDSRGPIFAVVIDGSAVGAVINACEEAGIRYLAATQFSGDVSSSSVQLLSL
ncbi:MAG TPA: DNA primase DnaG [Candidatus Nanoarchaeia archaeon]|nr:DNA primase DnaG [Candidatus Nanoarchaeia archaeon]